MSPFAEDTDVVLIPQPCDPTGDQRLSEVKHCLILCFTKRKRGDHSFLSNGLSESRSSQLGDIMTIIQ